MDCKTKCPHAVKCSRRNPYHFKEFDHPHLNALLEKEEPLQLPADYAQDKQIVKEQLEMLRDLRNLALKPMAERLKENEPYNVFFTTISDAPQTYNQQNSITFTDLLCPSLGELKCSLQINFMIDITWLMKRYVTAGQEKKPLTILYGCEWPDIETYVQLVLPNVTEHYVQMKDGLHHSKVGIYVYSDNSLRVVVSTANLYYEDWNCYCQGLWVSPLCPILPRGSSDKAGESPTNFKSTLLSYLQHYNIRVLENWIDYVKRADFSNVKVFLITSAPGVHAAVPKPVHCHLHSVGELLSHHCVLPAKTTPTRTSEDPLSWDIIAQSSSIGLFGKDPAEWLRGTLLRSIASHKDCRLPANSNATISIIFPTTDNVLGSYYGGEGGDCLSYSKSVNEKQKWLKDYLHQWKADHTNRSRAMPHTKIYCRISPCKTKLSWFLITSANISRSGWGGILTKTRKSYVRSYEVGVLFLPKYFDETYFQIKDAGDNTKLFPFIYDIPLTPYKNSDEPWCN